MEQPSSKVFEYRIAAASNDIDELDHVNNIVYLRWVQETASAHWNVLSNDAIHQKICLGGIASRNRLPPGCHAAR